MASFLKEAFLLAATLTYFISLVTGYTLVTSIPVPAGSAVPQRLEINTFIKDSIRLNILYIALEKMQTTPTNQTLSFYQISGIHGTPVPWDGDGSGSYCYHNHPLFLTWHRPYLLLFEKTLLDLATGIVNTFPNGTVKTNHLTALKTWRMPYWDWAIYPSLPSVFNSAKTVTVTKMVSGTLKSVSIKNPLYSYTTNPTDQYTIAAGNSASGPVTKETVRNPKNQSNVWVSQPTVTNAKVTQEVSTLQYLVYNAFSMATNYISFSSSADSDYSIESPHGYVHVLTGGPYGHMSSVSASAFDPIFYFHHCNIDRYFALWQAIYPGQYLSQNLTDVTNEDTPLHPFRITDTQYWTSKLARYTVDLGYTYPELATCSQQCVNATINCTQACANATVDCIQKCVSTTINSLYNPTSSNGKKKRNAIYQTPIYNEYSIKIKVLNAAANGSFRIFFYLGNPSKPIDNYYDDPNYIGLFIVFAQKNMHESEKKHVRGTVSITKALQKLVSKGILLDMEPQTVKKYVKDKIQWVIEGENNGSYNMAGLKIQIVSAKVKPPKDECSFPTREDVSAVQDVV